MATYLLAPGDSRGWYGGGLFTILRLGQAVGIEVVTYREPSVEGRRHLDEVEHEADATFVVCWGSHVAELLDRLAGRRVAYWANSVGWRARIPPTVPVLCASRFTLGHWAENAPGSPLYLLPNIVADEFHPGAAAVRDVDVLVVERKTSAYVLDRVVPALAGRGLRTEVVRQHVDDIAALYRRSTVFLYDSREHWLRKRVSEGFGLPPLEAAACGCAVFTSINAGLSDFVDPGHGWHQIGVHDLAHDVARIAAAAAAPPEVTVDVAPYRAAAVRRRWEVVTAELDAFWRERAPHSDVPSGPVPPRRYDPVSPSLVGRVRGRLGRTTVGARLRSRR